MMIQLFAKKLPIHPATSLGPLVNLQILLQLRSAQILETSNNILKAGHHPQRTVIHTLTTSQNEAHNSIPLLASCHTLSP